jgi:hypothetical protein
MLDDVPTVHEAARGADGVLRLARAWHGRVMADEAVSHALERGFHPEHDGRLAERGPPAAPVLHDDFAWATTASMGRYRESARRRSRGPDDPALVVGRPCRLTRRKETDRCP